MLASLLVMLAAVASVSTVGAQTRLANDANTIVDPAFYKALHCRFAWRISGSLAIRPSPGHNATFDTNDGCPRFVARFIAIVIVSFLGSCPPGPISDGRVSGL